MLKERLTEDMKAAMKSGDAFALGILRMAIAAVNTKSIEKRGKGLPPEMSDEEVLDVLAKEAKRREDSVQQFTEGGRPELAEAELKEREFLAKYLPAQMAREDVVAAVEAIISASTTKDFPMVMKEAMTQLKGKADGKLVGEIVKERLA
ncbi:MAG: GatB/YqeY domain-containing protein [bacterium]|nr:GatB/YqeY domain-containing protein [bacterium]